jgi:hypothetical protein
LLYEVFRNKEHHVPGVERESEYRDLIQDGLAVRI